ncbi:type 2 isopentenyl-diphosphate Delta-isomerase [candidate division KSB1 bacterium]|nr:type 2 isopentenyl-diphosphate Delta-isomerase [candidate division KSB1 bacterium]
MSDAIAIRKEEHVTICLNKDVNFREKTAGFEKIQLAHSALPEINFQAIDTTVQFLGKTLSFPLMISGMTGGFQGARQFNHQLAEVCQARRIALGLGSIRQAIKNPDFLDSYQIMARVAPDIPIIGNIGAAQVIAENQRNEILRLVDKIKMDALAVHLNPLQEILQPEGDHNFEGVLPGIEKLISLLPIPVMVKETGAGISGAVARRLHQVGVNIIDVSGAGGTSWAAVEYYRSSEPEIAASFWDWGIPTVDCLFELKSLDGVQKIASGGVRNGLDIAKACVLNATLAGAAQPFLKELIFKGPEYLDSLILSWQKEFQIVMFLTGCKKTSALPDVPFKIVQ